MSEKSPQDAVSIQRAVSVEFIRNSGGYAVKCKPGQKDPARGWDPKTNNKQKSDALLSSIEFTNDNIGIHLHGSLVDIDVDSDTPGLMPALERFLPPCSHVWGHRTRPRTHRVYQLNTPDFDPANHQFLRRIQKIPEAKIEIRGGPPTRAEYSLLPGSIHPATGDMYEWADLGRARSSLSVATPSQLLRAVRLAGAVAVLVPHWQEGLRNDLTMALSGFLHRAWQISQNFDDEDVFTMDRDGSKQFLEVLLEVTGDDVGDTSARLQTFERTWNKAEKGVPVTGATTIADITGDESIVPKLYTLLTSSPDVAAIEEFTSRFAIWQGPGLAVDMEAAAKGNPRPFMTRQQFQNSWGHKSITIDGKRKLLPDLLFHYNSTLRVAGVTFEPGAPSIVDGREGRLINQWSGFEIPPWVDPVTDEDVKPFLRYLYEVVCNEKREHYDWVIAWLAHIFKEPANKSKTALVLVGLPGAGKSILGHLILIPIIGNQHAASTNTVDSVTKDFNVAFDNKIFVQCDEATNNRQKSVASRLKSLVTDPMKLVEPKGVDSFMKPNHMRFLFTSNDIEDALYLNDGMDDRRYTVLEVSARYKDKVSEYWDPFVEWLQDKENLSRVHRYLRDYNYDPLLITRPLVTDAKILMQQRSWDPFDAWLATWVARGHPLSEYVHDAWYDAPVGTSKDLDRSEWPDMISTAALIRDYTSYCKHQSRYGSDPLNEHQMSVCLRRRGLTLKDGRRLRVSEFDEKKGKRVTKRVRVYNLPSRSLVEEYLRRKHGVDMTEAMLKDAEEPTEKEEF